MQIKKRQWTMTVLTFLASTSVFAQWTPYGTLSVPCGWFVEANVGSAQITGKNYPGHASSSGIGGSANLGYKFFPYFATEINYTQYSSTSIRLPLTGQKAATDKHYSYGIDFKGILPIWASGFELFGKVGAARMSSRLSLNNQFIARRMGLTPNSHSKSGLFAGVGGQYNWTPEIASVIQYTRVWGNNSTGSGNLFSIGFALITD